MKKRSLKKLLGISLALSLSACASVPLTDNEWCGPYSKGAECFSTLSETPRSMSSEEFAIWLNDSSDPKLCTNVDSFANWKKAILKLCSRTKLCTSDFKKKVNELYFKTQRFKQVK